MNYYIVRATQERFFVIRASSEKDALDQLLESVIAIDYQDVEIILADFDKGLMDSREYNMTPFKPNWKWDGRGSSPIKAKTAKA